MKNKTMSVLLCISLIISIITLLGFVGIIAFAAVQTPEYTLYIGTNDKDTGESQYSYDEAAAIVNSICSKYFSGYTLYKASGHWTDTSGNLINENTIVCYVTEVNKEKVKNAVDELLDTLNQYSIIVEAKKALVLELTREMF
ncbi:MAG TPA: DUF3574 domain-containing protein [Methanocorpusculum sp.]|nr:DUF3574 domain-containing protein [Methanocorpusculum sp.]